MINPRQKTTEQFINEAKSIHGDRYDYSNVEYTGAHNKVKIICSIHNVFEQSPHTHLKGQGCRFCGAELRGRNQTVHDNEFFIKKSKSFHGDKYDYSLVNYKASGKRVKIVCPEHGLFEQIAYEHYTGAGCYLCGNLNNLMETKLFNNLRDYFLNLNINVVSQGRPKWLGRLSLDIYLPDYNIGIEYQGIQHFKSVNFFGGQEGLEKRIRLDKKKYDLCLFNNCKLFYFSYDNSYIPKEIDNVYFNEEVLVNAITEEVRGSAHAVP